MFLRRSQEERCDKKMVSDNVAADGGAVLFVAPGVEFAGGVLGFGFVEAEHLEGAGERGKCEVAVAEFLDGVGAPVAVGVEADAAGSSSCVQSPPRVLAPLEALGDVVFEAGVADFEVDGFVVVDEVRGEAFSGAA